MGLISDHQKKPAELYPPPGERVSHLVMYDNLDNFKYNKKAMFIMMLDSELMLSNIELNRMLGLFEETHIDISRKYNIIPLFQPCGELSAIKEINIIMDILQGKLTQFEWCYRSVYGQLIPVTVDVMRRNENGVNCLVGIVTRRKKTKP